MQRKSPKLLADIHASASFILHGTSGKTIADYQSDPTLHSQAATLLREATNAK